MNESQIEAEYVSRMQAKFPSTDEQKWICVHRHSAQIAENVVALFQASIENAGRRAEGPALDVVMGFMLQTIEIGLARHIAELKSVCPTK